jgi:predicted SAM-dependent methyltransferase
MKEVKVDLACGDSKREGFIGVDIANIDSVDIVHDLNIYPWPFEDDSVDEIHCSHYVEHIPHLGVQAALKVSETFEEFKEKLSDDKDGFIKFFNEMHRILKPEGKATVSVPHYMSVRAFGDPTHQRYVGDFSFYYLNKEWRDNNKLSHYGLTADFDMTYSYHISDELILKSQEVRTEAFQKDWNAVNDIIVEFKKR